MAISSACTLADYLAFDDPDGPQYELSEGELLVSPSATPLHNRLRDRLSARLRDLLEPSLGYVTSESDYQLGANTVRRPDVAVILAARFRPEFDRQVPIPIAPDLAFEIVSDHDRAGALLLKVRQYLEASTAAVWLLYPALRVAHRYGAPAAAPTVSSADQEWQEPELLPGIRFAFSEFLG